MPRYLMFLLCSVAYGQSCSSIPVGYNLGANGGRLNGFVPFPLSAYWHRDVSGLTPDPNSTAYISDVRQGGDRRFLSAYPASQNNGVGAVDGFPYHVVAGSQPRVNVHYDLATGQAAFVNGSTSVTWVSGGQFSAGMTSIDIGTRPNSPYIVNDKTYQVASSTNTTITLALPFTGASGTYPWGLASVPSSSEPGPMPIPLSPIEQNSLVANNPFPSYVYASTTDGHVIVLDKDNCVLYELFNVLWDGHAIHAGTGAVFDLLGGDNQRPVMFTSASVSGLPLFPGFLRDEELNGSVPINHPITVSLAVMAGSGNFYPKHSWIAPAEHHQYATGFNPWWLPSNIPVGAVLRLVPGFDVSGYPAQGQLLLNAMKKYGVIFVDGGDTVDFYSASGWNWDPLTTEYLYDHFAVTTSDFEVITSGNPIYCDPMYATAGYNGGHTPICPNSTSSITGPAPVISSFTASSYQVPAGTAVTLSWSVSGASTRLRYVTPYVGPVTGESVTINVPKTTIFTLMVENYYGQTTSNLTVMVQ